MIFFLPIKYFKPHVIVGTLLSSYNVVGTLLFSYNLLYLYSTIDFFVDE